MTVSVSISQSVEAALTERARALGLPIERYIALWIERQLA
jgi:hypothetical protein